VLTSSLGIGGGFIMVPAMIYLLRIPTNIVVGTSLFQIIFVSAYTTVVQAVTNYAVDIVLATILMMSSVIGAQYGVRVGQKLKGEQLRALLALLILAVGVRRQHARLRRHDDPFRSLGNPVVWQGPGGLVWLFYVTRFGDTWSTSRIKVKISRDGAASWSDSALLTIEPGTMVRAHPIVLQTGEYLLPIYHETGHDTELVGPDTTSFFLRYNPSNKKWSRSKRIRSDHGNLQPAVAQVDDKHLIAYCRRGGGYEPTTEGYLIRSESRDGGHTWGKGTNSSFPNPNSAVDFIKLRSGRLLLVYNHNMNDRTPLTAALSSDNGKTFSHRMNIAAGQDSFAYPTIVQTEDGRIHVTFTSQERTQINHAIFDENDLLSKPDNKKSEPRESEELK